MNKFKGENHNVKGAKWDSNQKLKQSANNNTSTNTSHIDIFQSTWPYTIIPVLALVILSIYLLLAKGEEYLFAIQNNSLFISGEQFLDEKMIIPGGFLQWLGLYFCQDFYHPALGTFLLIIIWLATFFGTIKIFHLKNVWASLAIIPLFMLLASIVEIGYFIYYIKEAGYWFKESLGFFFTIYLVWGEQAANKYINKWASPIYTILIIVFGYHLLGWWALFAGIIILCKKDSSIYTRIASAIMIGIIPFIATKQYTTMRYEDAWIKGFPLFQSDNITYWSLEIPFIILSLFCVILALTEKFLPQIKSNIAKIGTVIILTVIGAIFVFKNDNNTETFIKELSMHRAAMEQRWDDVLTEATDVSNGVTRQIVLLKNLALTQQGKFGEHFTDYDNGGNDVIFCDSLQIHLAQTCGPLLYFSYGKVNFSTRWCIENSVEFGETIQRLQIMLWNALIVGEKDVAEKYINILKQTKYYKQWAEKYEPILEDSTRIYDTEKYPEFAMSKELYDNCGDILDGDQGYVEIYLLNYFSHTNNINSKKLNEVTLNFACIQKDIQLFWQKFFTYAQLHKGEPMPRIYQEAAFLFCNLEKEYDPQNMPFTQDVINRYNSFQVYSQSLMAQNKSQEEIGELMKPMYGNTYWWFYFFCRGIKSY